MTANGVSNSRLDRVDAAKVGFAKARRGVLSHGLEAPIQETSKWWLTIPSGDDDVRSFLILFEIKQFRHRSEC